MKTKRKNTELRFVKMSGAGNDFIIISALSKKEQKDISLFLKNTSKQRLTKTACHRSLGLGADGLLFLMKAKDRAADVIWDFYNSDGSRAEMCANAARCVTRFASLKLGKDQVRIQTAFGVIEGVVNSNRSVSVKIKSPRKIDLKKQIDYKGKKVIGGWIDSGVPHFVVFGKNIFSSQKLLQVSRSLRGHRDLGSRGANITWVEKVNQNRVRAISFERGVENFTMACGTGAVAAALFYHHKNKQENPIYIQMPGGQLKVKLYEDCAVLTGPAHYVAEGFLNNEVLDV